MNMEFSVFSIQQGEHDFISDTHQYWILLTGSGIFTTQHQSFILISHDVLEYPQSIPGHFSAAAPVMVGCIKLSDFLATNTKVKHLPKQDTELIRKVFFFAFDMQGIQHPHISAMMNAINQLMLEILLSMDLVKETIPACVIQVLEDINTNYLNSNYNIAEVIQKTGYSLSHFRKLFKKYVGIPPLEFINQRRLENAKMLMRQQRESLSIKQIAYQSGFTDAYYFSRLFKKSEDMTPTEYIQQLCTVCTSEDEQI